MEKIMLTAAIRKKLNLKKEKKCLNVKCWIYMYYQKLSGSVDVCRLQTYIINNSLFVYFYNIYECNRILYPPCLPVSLTPFSFLSLYYFVIVSSSCRWIKNITQIIFISPLQIFWDKKYMLHRNEFIAFCIKCSVVYYLWMRNTNF